MKKCLWTEKDHLDDHYWVTECGHIFTFVTGSPWENEMVYCCFCGRVLWEKRAKRNDRRKD